MPSHKEKAGRVEAVRLLRGTFSPFPAQGWLVCVGAWTRVCACVRVCVLEVSRVVSCVPVYACFCVCLPLRALMLALAR